MLLAVIPEPEWILRCAQHDMPTCLDMSGACHAERSEESLSECERNLDLYLEQIWYHYFFDVPRANIVKIAYCHPWKRRLGLIRLSLDNTVSFIGINALLRNRQVPEYVLITTIAHELTHYAHGFGSPLPRIHKHPHANNIVNRELEKRGLGELAHRCAEWIDKYWFAFYDIERGPGRKESPGLTTGGAEGPQRSDALKGRT